MKNAERPIHPTTTDDRRSDSPISGGLTKREYACIKLGIPETGDTELDDLINKSERKRIAGLAMRGLLSNSEWMKEYKGEKYLMQSDIVAEVSVNFADKILKQLRYI